MGLYDRYVLPRLTVWTLETRLIHRERKKALAGVRGRVLELGFGAGLNLPHYPEGVRELVGVDPSQEMAALGRERVAQARFPVEHVALAGEDLPVDPGSFDAAVSTFTLCTIPDATRALENVRRALVPGGKLYFLEHGRAPDPDVQRVQDRWNPIQKLIGGGCNVNRKIDDLVRGAGFELESIDRYYVKGPRFLSYFYRGVARAPG